LPFLAERQIARVDLNFEATLVECRHDRVCGSRVASRRE
jgi:hypothetical protein